MRLLFFFLSCCLTAVLSVRATPEDNAIYLRGEAKLVAEMTLGGGPDEGDVPPLFYRPRDVATADDGTIYVLDSETCQIVVFEASGQYRERFAGEGEGPGELREPTRIAIDRKGNVLVYEAGNKRFSWFSHDGYIIDAKRFDRDVVRFVCNRDGRIIAQEETEHYGSVWCASSTGEVYVARSAQYTIRSFGSDFRPAQTLSRKVPAAAITKEERKRYLDKLGGTALIGNALAEQVRWPPHRPSIEALYCDADGNVLVHRGSRKGAALVDVFRLDGTFLGEVEITGLNRSAIFHGTSIFMRVFSDEELPAVIRYRME